MPIPSHRRLIAATPVLPQWAIATTRPFPIWGARQADKRRIWSAGPCVSAQAVLPRPWLLLRPSFLVSWQKTINLLDIDSILAYHVYQSASY